MNYGDIPKSRGGVPPLNKIGFEWICYNYRFWLKKLSLSNFNLWWDCLWWDCFISPQKAKRFFLLSILVWLCIWHISLLEFSRPNARQYKIINMISSCIPTTNSYTISQYEYFQNKYMNLYKITLLNLVYFFLD